MSARRLVYTALIGGYEELNEQPLAGGGVDFVCFTDDPELRSDTWDVRLVEPLLPLDPVRSARSLKIQGPPGLEKHDETLWIDARVVLTAEPDAILDAWLGDADLAVPRHSFRRDVVTEFDAVLAAGVDDFGRLYEQVTHYSASSRDRLMGPVPWTGMLARRLTPAVSAAMSTWMLHVLRYSRRDQLSFAEAIAGSGVEPRLVEIDNIESDVHTWLAPRGRSTRRPTSLVADSLWSPVAGLGAVRQELEDAVAAASDAVTAREEAIEQRDAALAHRDAVIADRDATIAGHHAVLVDRDTRVAERDARVVELERRVAELEQVASLTDQHVVNLETALSRTRERVKQLRRARSDAERASAEAARAGLLGRLRARLR